MTGLINFTGFWEAGTRPFFTAVTKPDTFDVENKRVSKQLGLIKRAIGGGNVFLLRQPFAASGVSVNDSETVRLLSVAIKNGWARSRCELSGAYGCGFDQILLRTSTTTIRGHCAKPRLRL